MTQAALRLEPVSAEDFEALLALRIEAMRESLERIGRFDPARARERFQASFRPDWTRHVVSGDTRIGFAAWGHVDGHILLDHLYIRPDSQGRRAGAWVLEQVFREADAAGLPVRVGALRESASNRFYERNGFRLVERAEFDNYYVRSAAA